MGLVVGERHSQKEQLPDVDGGDVYLQPLNMVNAGQDESI
jgi:hypothetical protein